MTNKKSAEAELQNVAGTYGVDEQERTVQRAIAYALLAIVDALEKKNEADEAARWA